ncbi:MAG: M23 family metallopeptidase [Patescibacteria group bacterium]
MPIRTKVFAAALVCILFGCTQTSNSNSPVAENSGTKLSYPIENFATGITKKPFGIYITPKTSPVQPERFTGYHTGVDIETTAAQKDADVWVYAIADGKVELKRRVNGYGGVLILSYVIDGQTYSALYGHLNLPGNLQVGDTVKAKQALTTLGAGFSTATDGERKHLHFSLKPGLDLDLRGYVENESELSGWIDPVKFFSEH